MHFIYRSCDSKNQNLSPLCHLDSKEDAYLWGDDITGLYSAMGTTPEYIADIPDTKRPNYKVTYKVIPFHI